MSYIFGMMSQFSSEITPDLQTSYYVGQGKY